MRGAPPVAVVIPCYKARRHIAEVLAGLPGRVRHIYVVDDCCSEQTGRFVQEGWKDANVGVVFLTEKQGVGGAVLAGYHQALEDGHEIVVKMDGDNQMDPAYLPALIAPLVQGEADYAKGNRFFDVYSLGAMPAVDAATPDIRVTTRVGRERNGSFGASGAENLPFARPEPFGRRTQSLRSK